MEGKVGFGFYFTTLCLINSEKTISRLVLDRFRKYFLFNNYSETLSSIKPRFNFQEDWSIKNQTQALLPKLNLACIHKGDLHYHPLKSHTLKKKKVWLKTDIINFLLFNHSLNCRSFIRTHS